MARTKIEERLERAREGITGESGTDGLQAWFRREIAARTDDGWRPGKATVHRWVTGSTALDERAEEVLEELEAEAEEAEAPEPEPARMPGMGDKRERNILLVADWIRGDSLRVLGERYDVSPQRAQELVDRANVRRLESAPA